MDNKWTSKGFYRLLKKQVTIGFTESIHNSATHWICHIPFIINSLLINPYRGWMQFDIMMFYNWFCEIWKMSTGVIIGLYYNGILNIYVNSKLNGGASHQSSNMRH